MKVSLLLDLGLARAIPYTKSTDYFLLPHVVIHSISHQDPGRWPIGTMESWPTLSWGYNKMQLSIISVVSHLGGPLPS